MYVALTIAKSAIRTVPWPSCLIRLLPINLWAFTHKEETSEPQQVVVPRVGKVGRQGWTGIVTKF